MSTQVVKHTSRGFDITINFAATENNLSWSFTQEGDGEIYDIALTNVASYTIAGGAVALPYSVTNGTSYAVSIVKTTTGQTASITFKTRRATIKSNTVTVPDFGSHTGRYLYVLTDIGTVEKHDMSVKQPANYTGSGTWDTSSLVATITLPTLPTNYSWYAVCYIVKSDGQGMILCGGVSSVGKGNFKYCKIINDVVYNLSETTQDTYTDSNTPTTTSALTVVKYVYPTFEYDYINNIVYFRTVYSAAVYIEQLNISTNLFAYSSSYISPLGGNNQLTRVFFSLIPTTAEFLVFSKYFYANELRRNYSLPLAYASYDSTRGNIVGNGAATNLAWFDEYDIQTKALAPAPNAGGSSGGCFYSNVLKQCFVGFSGGATFTYGIYDDVANAYSSYVVSNPYGTTEKAFKIAVSNYSGIWVLTQQTAAIKRLHFIKYGQTPPDYGYLDINNGIRCLTTTQLRY